MHGATIYIDVLGASRVCMDKSFFNNVRPNFGQLSFPLLFSISAIKCALVPFYGIPSMLGIFCFHRHGACLEANAQMRACALTHGLVNPSMLGTAFSVNREHGRS